MLEVYEHRCGSLSGLEAILGILDKSEQLVLCPAPPPETCLRVTQELVCLKPMVEPCVNHPLSNLAEARGQGDRAVTLRVASRLTLF